MWSSPNSQYPAYKHYWFGILDGYGVKADTLLCPSANTPIYSDPFSPIGLQTRGYGAVFNCWTGRFGPNGTAITLTVPTRAQFGRDGDYRDGSYGYNRYLTAQFDGLGGFGSTRKTSNLLEIHDLANVPAFMDCVFGDVQPDNYSFAAPPKLPKDLTGMSAMPGTPGQNDLWKLLIARHGTAINVGMADGSARLVPLTDLYMLTWNAGWQKYPLQIQ
jgi:prepilin-type processing-associated H-X9-DG protein